ncbi:VanZ family protein [Brevibacillus fluminis]|uniref:VanZ family protein n=1 Tax=Brevibacillus fluminis TaxID=511487 RepID=UPI003F8B6525
METKARKLVLAGTVLYSLLILYFMFFAFNRLRHSDFDEYVFMLVPEKVPLKFPELSFFWLFDFGNIAAFLPFGVLIPMLYRTRFWRFITGFMAAILVLETLQAITRLGSFDVDDVISNTIGAAIGYAVYRVGFAGDLSLKKVWAAALTAVALLFGVMVMSEALVKREGPIRALSEWKEATGSEPVTVNLASFTVQGQKIEPKWNVYSSQGEQKKTYTYYLGNKTDVTFYSVYGIPDQAGSKGEVTIEVDGIGFAQLNEQYAQGAEAIVMPLPAANEITIAISGNAKLWDVGISEQKHWWE